MKKANIATGVIVLVGTLALLGASVSTSHAGDADSSKSGGKSSSSTSGSHNSTSQATSGGKSGGGDGKGGGSNSSDALGTANKVMGILGGFLGQH
jgi:hypothetical protein